MAQRVNGITHILLSFSVLALLSACGGSSTQPTVDNSNPPTGGNPNPPSNPGTPNEPTNPGTGDPGTPNEPSNPGTGDPGTPNEPSNPGTGDPGTPNEPSFGEQATATADTDVLTSTRTTVYNLDSPALGAGGWKPTALLETGNVAASSPRVAFDRSGDGFAVWAQGSDLMASRYDAASAAWGNAVVLDNSNEAVFQARIAVDRASGNAIAVWTQSDGVAASLHASRFNTLTYTWSAAELLEAAADEVDINEDNSNVAVNGSHAAVTWLQDDGAALSIYLSRLVSGSWTAPVLVENSSAAGQLPKVAIDPNGNVTIAWRQFDGSGFRINTRRWDNTAQAFDAVLPMNLNGDRQPVLQFDAVGNGFLLWRAGPIARRFDSTTGQWSAEFELRNPGATSDAGDISVDDSGNAMAVWVETDVATRYIYSRRYNAAAGSWADAELLETASGVAQPTVSMSGDDAVVSWLRHNASSVDDVYSIKQTDGVWGTARLLETRDSAGAAVTSTINAAGNAAVVWAQADDSNVSIYEARYLSPNIVVAAGDTWQALANELYQANSFAAGAALQAAMGGMTLTEGMVLTGFPATLTVTVTVPGFYTVLATDTWAHVASTVYGVTDTAAIAVLRAALGNPTLSAGLQLVVPSSFQYVTSANFSAPLDWSRVNTTATEHYQLDDSMLTVPLADWSTPQKLEANDDDAATGPSVMYDAQGNGMAVWSEGSDVIARRYTAAAGWSAPTVLDANTNTASLSRVFVDRTSGNAVAAWVQSDGVALSVYVSTYEANTNTWSAALLLDASDDEVSFVWGPAVARSGEHAAVTWIQSNGGLDHTYMSRLVAGTWTAALRIDTGAGQCMQTEAAVDANGNVTVSWRQLDPGTGFHINTRRWDNTALAYGPVMRMNADGDRQGKLGMDAQGNAVLMWRGFGIQVRHYDVTTGQWSAQQALSNDPGAGTAALSVSASGDALAAWPETLGGVSTIYASYYDASADTWSVATAIADNINIYRVSVSLVGNSGVVGIVSDSGSVSGEDVYAVRLQDGVWGAATLLETLPNPASEVNVHIDASNTATVMWVQIDDAAPSIFTAYSNSTPYYLVPAAATWQSLASTLYNAVSAAAAAALEAVMAPTTLSTGLHLQGLPATLVVTPTVPTYYLVQSGDTWQSIALALYGTSRSEASTALWNYLGQPTLTVGQMLAIPSQLDYAIEE
jgi:hypothetical protein